MPLERDDLKHLQAAHGYIELGMFLEGNAELEEIDQHPGPFTPLQQSDDAADRYSWRPRVDARLHGLTSGAQRRARNPTVAASECVSRLIRKRSPGAEMRINPDKTSPSWSNLPSQVIRTVLCRMVGQAKYTLR